jgi:ABC-type amino acid transport substrate-binding protein
LTTQSGAEQQKLTANQGRVLRAVIPLDSPHTYFKDAKSGEAAGFAVDFMHAVGKQTGYVIQYQFRRDWQDVLAALAGGAADIAPGCREGFSQ